MEWWPFMMMTLSALVLLMMVIFVCKRWCANCNQTTRDAPSVVNTNTQNTVFIHGPSDTLQGYPPAQSNRAYFISSSQHTNMAYAADTELGLANPADLHSSVPPPYSEAPPTYEEFLQIKSLAGEGESDIPSGEERGEENTTVFDGGSSTVDVNTGSASESSNVDGVLDSPDSTNSRETGE